MKDWRDIQDQTPQEKSPQSAGRLPVISREIILMLFVGVMAVLGLRRHYRPEQREEDWRARHHAARPHRSYLAIKPYRFGIDEWACDPRRHWRLQVRARWLSSRDINNSPDPRIRRIGYDEWYTRRPYSRVPGICIANIRQAPLRDFPETLCQVARRSRGAARRLKHSLAGNTVKAVSLIPP